MLPHQLGIDAMIVHRLPYVIFREFPNYGYLTDNRNFGYDTASKSCLKLGNLFISKTGSVFFSILKETPQEIDDVIAQLCLLFPNVPTSTIRDDATYFFLDLHSRGYIYYGEKSDAVSIEDYSFSYANKQEYKLKIAEHSDDNTSYDKFFGVKPWLTRVHIDISSRCNENCKHCYIPSEKKRGMMSEKMFDNILRQCKELNVLNITISGGEPMLNPHLCGFLAKCQEKNFSVNLLSNLTLLNEELLATISNNPLISVQTSLYAMNESVHDSITKSPGSYRKTVSAIKRMHDRNIPMQINCPIMRQNVEYYKDVLLFASSLNIEADADYSLYGTYDLSGSNLSCRLSTDEIENLIKSDTKTLAKMAPEDKNCNEDDPICPVCKNSLCISNIGEVYPCEGWQSLKIGNLQEQSLKEIWEDGVITNRLRDLTFKDFPKCNTCPDKHFCNLCLIMNVNEDLDGNYMKVNSFQCNVARIKKKCFLQ